MIFGGNIFYDYYLVEKIRMKSILQDLPDIKEIRKLEKSSQKEGSGIVYEDLLGMWKFQFVWKKGSDDMDNISSSILQILSAKLQLIEKTPGDKINFEIKNSISFGLLNIIFVGTASLKGQRPLLTFYFENLKVGIGNFSLISKSLKQIELKKMPFFSLIGISREDSWMCARGKGGGLAIWIKP